MKMCLNPMCISNGKIKAYTQNRIILEPETITIPCGKCENCRLNKANEWKNRLILEATEWPHAYFITFTYDDKNINWVYGPNPVTGEIKYNPTLRKTDMQKFIKRMRKEFANTGDTLKYFYCGEYGDATLRPHYHMILFSTKKLEISDIEKTEIGKWIGVNDLLGRKWTAGNHVIAEFEPATAAYVARYTLKKTYESKTLDDKREKEYINMSKRPSIGYEWITKHLDKIMKTDKIIPDWVENENFKIPNTYLNTLRKNKLITDEQIEKIKAKRKQLAKSIENENLQKFRSLDEMLQKEKYLVAERIKQLKQKKF